MRYVLLLAAVIIATFPPILPDWLDGAWWHALWVRAKSRVKRRLTW